MLLFRKARHYLEYLAVRSAAVLFAVLPWETASAAGAFLGRIASRIIYKRFRLTVKNISQAFPAKTPQEVNEIAVKSWENMGRTGAEFAKAVSLSKTQLLEKCRLENTEKLRACLDSGKGAIIHIGHFANWELIGLAFNAAGFNVTVVARRIRNPYIDAWLTQMRKKFGGEIISHKSPFFSCVKSLKKGRMLGILMDQNMPAGEIFTPFLGRQAATTPLTALLALKTGAPVFPVRVVRRGNTIVGIYEEPMFPETSYSPESLYREILRLNARLEAWIREEPHLWLWAHNRWKREKDALKAINNLKTQQETEHEKTPV